MAPSLFNYNDSWRILKLSTSFRLTGNMAIFVNEVMLGRRQIAVAKGLGRPVHYVQGCVWSITDWVSRAIVDNIRNGNLLPEDVFILAASIKARSSKSKTPLRKLENMLVDSRIPVFTPTDDQSRIDPEVAHGKVIFSSFHQCKGLERKFVVVFGFDANYFTYYACDADKNTCPCTLYVAATRATETLILVGHDPDKPGTEMPFFVQGALKRLAAQPSPPVVFPDTECPFVCKNVLL